MDRFALGTNLDTFFLLQEPEGNKSKPNRDSPQPRSAEAAATDTPTISAEATHRKEQGKETVDLPNDCLRPQGTRVRGSDRTTKRRSSRFPERADGEGMMSPLQTGVARKDTNDVGSPTGTPPTGPTALSIGLGTQRPRPKPRKKSSPVTASPAAVVTQEFAALFRAPLVVAPPVYAASAGAAAAAVASGGSRPLNKGVIVSSGFGNERR